MTSRAIQLFLFLFGTVPALCAPVDCTHPKSFTEWMTCRAMKPELQQKLIGASTERQSAQPSVSDASTSLLDRTSGPDLVGAGFQLLGAGSRTQSGNKSGDGVVTASAYALYTSFSGQKPLDPAVYARGVNWRRVSFSAGYETPGQQGSTDKKYKVVGTKILLINKRDVSSDFAMRKISSALEQVGSAARGLDIASTRIQNLMYELVGHVEDPTKYPLPPTPAAVVAFLNAYLDDATFANTIGKLSEDKLSEVDRILNSAGAIEGLIRQDTELQKLIFDIRRAPQLSISWTGKLSDTNQGADIHRLQAIFDWGVWKNFEITINGGYDYNNSRVVGGDTRAGRLAAEGHFELNPISAVARGVNPWVIAFSGEQNWVYRAKDNYKLQGRLEIPLTAGVSLPISLTFASSSNLIKESEIRGQVGFTIDASKLLSALKAR